MKLKMCSECRKPLPLDNFYKDKQRCDGRDIFCKPCKNMIVDGYRDKEKLREYQRKWYQERRWRA